jgi:hypothetical protein
MPDTSCESKTPSIRGNLRDRQKEARKTQMRRGDGEIVVETPGGTHA